MEQIEILYNDKFQMAGWISTLSFYLWALGGMPGQIKAPISEGLERIGAE